MKRIQKGFTLIELMITLAVIAILSAIAYPSYQDHVRRGVRSQGQQFLMDLAQRQEQFFLDNRGYATDLGNGAGLLNMSIPVEVSNKYTLQQPFAVNNAATPPTFTLVLTPIAGGMMAVDGALVVNNQQMQWREVDGNSAYDTPNKDCLWTDARCTPH